MLKSHESKPKVGFVTDGHDLVEAAGKNIKQSVQSRKKFNLASSNDEIQAMLNMKVGCLIYSFRTRWTKKKLP